MLARVDPLLDRPKPDTHFIQLYEANEDLLEASVARYVEEGLKQESVVFLVAGNRHWCAFHEKLVQKMGAAAVESALEASRLVFLNASDTLARFMLNGYPDAERFENSVGKALKQALARAEVKGVRAYGEMVGLLWATRQFPAAIRLEQLWNKLRAELPFTLFCSYPIDIFSKHFDKNLVGAILCAHSHFLPAPENGKLEAALQRAMSEVLELGSRRLTPSAPVDQHLSTICLPRGEALILWIREHLPEQADQILTRARRYYRTSLFSMPLR